MKELFEKSQLNFLINPVQNKKANIYYMISEVVGTWKIGTEATTTKENKIMKKNKKTTIK